MHKILKIGICNKSEFETEIIKQNILHLNNVKIIWTSLDTHSSILMLHDNIPDILLLDTNVGSQQLIETINITKSVYTKVIITSNQLKKFSSLIYKALNSGAYDFLDLPTTSNDEKFVISETFLNKIKSYLPTAWPTSNKYKTSSTPKKNPLLIAIGASTGGPQALAIILSQFPKDFEPPIVIIQHVHNEFSSNFINWIQQNTLLPVNFSKGNEPPQKFSITIASSNHHLIYGKDHKLHYEEDPKDLLYRPSIDIFFKSLAKNAQRTGIAILLTGIGQDGAEGLLALKRKHWHTIVQDQESSVVYGMPKAAIEYEAASQVLNPYQIPQVILNNEY